MAFFKEPLWDTWAKSVWGQIDPDVKTTDATTNQLYGSLGKTVGNYKEGKERELNRYAMEQLREDIRLQALLIGSVHDLRESIAKDRQNAYDNWTKMQVALTTARNSLSKSRSPAHSYIYTQAMKGNQSGGTSEMINQTMNAYAAQTGTLGRVDDSQMFNILSEVGRGVEGTFGIDDSGELFFDKTSFDALGPSQKNAVDRWLTIANAGQHTYVNELSAFRKTEATITGIAQQVRDAPEGEKRDELARQLESEIDKLLPRFQQSEGLGSIEDAQRRLDDAIADDAYYGEVFKTQQFLGRKIRGDDANTMAKAIGNERFRSWAEENGFKHLGYVQPDGTYVVGKHDKRAVMAFNRQVTHPNRYGRLGSPGATTGEFVRFQVKMDPARAGTIANENGDYAYVTSPTRSTTILPEEAARIEAMKEMGLIRLTVHDSDDDPSPEHMYYDPTTGDYHLIHGADAVTLSSQEMAQAAASYEWDLSAIIEAGEVVMRDGRPVSIESAAALHELLADDAAEYLDPAAWEAHKAKLGTITYSKEVPGTYEMSGEKMKPQGNHEVNPEYDDGYIEILTPTGLQIFKADQIDGPVTVVAARSGTTMADAKWARLYSAMEAPPEQVDPAEAPSQFSYHTGNIEVRTADGANLARTNSFDDYIAFLEGRREPTPEEIAESAAKQDAAKAEKRAQDKRREEIEFADEMVALEKAAASPDGGVVLGETLSQGEAATRLKAQKAQMTRGAEATTRDEAAEADLAEEEAEARQGGPLDVDEADFTGRQHELDTEPEPEAVDEPEPEPEPVVEEEATEAPKPKPKPKPEPEPTAEPKPPVEPEAKPPAEPPAAEEAADAEPTAEETRKARRAAMRKALSPRMEKGMERGYAEYAERLAAGETVETLEADPRMRTVAQAALAREKKGLKGVVARRKLGKQLKREFPESTEKDSVAENGSPVQPAVPGKEGGSKMVAHLRSIGEWAPGFRKKVRDAYDEEEPEEVGEVA